MKTDTLVAIPARYGSTRFEGKMLKMLEGKPIIQHVWEACKKAKVGEVIVATDDTKIFETVKNFGGEAIMTSPELQSGTDRIFKALKGRDEKYIINVQGDEPFIKPETVQKIVALLKSDSEADIATACIKTRDPKIITNPNAVKAVLTDDMKALYFSRAAIPFIRDIEETSKILFYHHFGIYGYKREALEKFVNHKQSTLEKQEKLEQLRALEIGLTIKSILIEKTGPSIDTQEDLDNAKEYLKNLK
ncbi:MAG: 3-deoxy-manno-octulosonate cytidylyltransferase [Elusimicrobiaceae bacterium]|jgi:3-deoxy-manno-octulosonate cytidylyltransferase (CMP-KDO synthetase)|nr:3-deoxy-manno-octulosonate cytidylyltransferase [Elusimicrobiaceae bacterium]MBT3955674.1 3-deoxy-manno-octulosonate cytidylyltransferase [Elusimicrobiaceae bacterium]MBT4008272.1 3-deoxy-manno-octulosonate cytidylyltransferase [Elusimicrobiaceae bacterium]MBT4402341.1 3-deoxy-manno-octulosonate cytidylyltransferase [Elusimicrobiaceae bacterium]MBT4439802.1 3-deoxy-manno-octulosonate cytidylyltransferase [Elusimicrobiaceae bacterium]